MPTLAELEAKWLHRLEEWRELGVSVNGERLAAEIVGDLRAIARGDEERTLSPTEASKLTGYHPESIARLVRTGHVHNYGTKHRPRVKLAELPRKATRVAKTAGPVPSSVAGSIAIAAVAGRIGRS